MHLRIVSSVNPVQRDIPRESSQRPLHKHILCIAAMRV